MLSLFFTPYHRPPASSDHQYLPAVICSWESNLIHGRSPLYFDMRLFPANPAQTPLLLLVNSLSWNREQFKWSIFLARITVALSSFQCLFFYLEICLLGSADHPVPPNKAAWIVLSLCLSSYGRKLRRLCHYFEILLATRENVGKSSENAEAGPAAWDVP